MAEKVTTMVLKVDLQCPCCYKKVKKIICKFPQIKDQVYKEKENKVVITVVCCNPEKIRDKLCCKGAKVIISIEIVDPLKPDKDPSVDQTGESKKPPPKDSKDAPQSVQLMPVLILGPGPCRCPPVSPVRNCCGPCSQGHGGGPCYFGHGSQPMPQPCFDGHYVYGCHDRPCHVTRCDYYFIEENPQACSIM